MTTFRFLGGVVVAGRIIENLIYLFNYKHLGWIVRFFIRFLGFGIAVANEDKCPGIF